MVRGHGLISEGKPHLVPGCCWSGDKPHRPWGYRRDGHGVCACGATSGHLGSDAQRKRWHKAHKQDVVDGRA